MHALVEWLSTVEVNPFILSQCLGLANMVVPAVFGPAATLWYRFLQAKIKFKNTNATIAARVLADQTIFASTNLLVFLSSMAYLEGSSPKAKLQSTYGEALKKNWMVWPAVQSINFKLVPLEHRVLVVNIVSLGWNCYLSYVNSRG